MRIEIVTPPDGTALSIDEVKDHLRLDHSSEDAYLSGLVQACVSAVETQTGLVLLERTLDLWMDRWPSRTASTWWDGLREGAISSLVKSKTRLSLPVHPVSAITQVACYNEEGAETLADRQSYNLRPGINPEFVPASGFNWSAATRAVDGVRIRVVAGFGASWNHIPGDIRQAILLNMAYLYVNRGDVPAGGLERSGAMAFLRPYLKARI